MDKNTLYFSEFSAYTLGFQEDGLIPATYDFFKFTF